MPTFLSIMNSSFPLVDNKNNTKRGKKFLFASHTSRITTTKGKGGASMMKATGIVRRIDDLGRVVIPKEIRRTLRIREGDPLEIFVDREGEVILKKYSPISELSDFAKEYAEALYDPLHLLILVADRDTYIAVSGGARKEYANKSIGRVVEEAIQERKTKVTSIKGEYNLVSDHEETMKGYAVAPIIANGDPIGAVVMIAKEGKVDEAISGKLLETAASFLARQMEQ